MLPPHPQERAHQGKLVQVRLGGPVLRNGTMELQVCLICLLIFLLFNPHFIFDCERVRGSLLRPFLAGEGLVPDTFFSDGKKHFVWSFQEVFIFLLLMNSFTNLNFLFYFK